MSHLKSFAFSLRNFKGSCGRALSLIIDLIFKVAVIAADVAERQKQCEEELIKAEPALVAATEALNTLNRNNLTELKTFAQPPPGVVNVVAAVMCLCAHEGRIPKERAWKDCRKFMGRVCFRHDMCCN